EFVFGPGGDIYAGHMGFDIRQGEPPRPARMARIRPDGHMALTGPELWFANGMALSVEGDALIVAESMAQRITRIPILPDGELGEAEIFADLSERGDHPDGLCVAADGSVWYAAHAHLTRVARGGAVLSRIALPFAFATSCVLGKGGDLYVTALRHRPGPDAPPQADAVLARVALPAHS
ncbi:MAG TPA: SMP-30/gluconolactonase/LRE family protein, partial [Novosphingobium sp.]|nr:SMP-30/gluconolactonase/LRE family protein [Novosphingobium sp.]